MEEDTITQFINNPECWKDGKVFGEEKEDDKQE